MPEIDSQINEKTEKTKKQTLPEAPEVHNETVSLE